jgi:hypothetical protein
MRVKQAEYVQEYKVKIIFSDGTIKIVDFKPFLKNAKNLFIPLLDIEYFKNFSVDDTTICWPNEVDFCPDVLHEIGVDIQEPQKTVKTIRRKHVSLAPRAMTKKRKKQTKS